MPNFERLAARGTAFERAHSRRRCARRRAPASPPAASTSAAACAGNDENYPLGQPTFYRSLRESGYRTLGCGKIDLATGEMTAGRGIGIDGKRFAHEWGFTDAINNGGKQAGSQIYLTEPVGPKDSYYVYLDDLTPPQGLICAEDFHKRGKPKENQYGDTRPVAARRGALPRQLDRAQRPRAARLDQPRTSPGSWSSTSPARTRRSTSRNAWSAAIAGPSA